MKTIRDTDNIKAALAAAKDATVAFEPSATVAECLERWLKIHTIGNKPRSVEFNQGLAAKFCQHWPDLQTRIAKG